MTEFRCPLCDGDLALPAGRHEAQTFLDALSLHFAESCTALRIPRATEPTPKGRLHPQS